MQVLTGVYRREDGIISPHCQHLSILRRPVAANTLKGGEYSLRQTLKLSPQEQEALAFGFVNLKPPPIILSEKSSSVPLR